MKKILIAFLSIAIMSPVFAQTDTIRGEEAAKLTKQITQKVIDTSKFLSEKGQSACHCIDSLKSTGKGIEELSKEIAACIDKEVTGYELLMKIYRSMTSGNKNDSNIILGEKNSPEYKYYYFEIERWLRDSCQSMSKMIASDNTERAFSVSKNETALAAYDQGVAQLNKNNFSEASGYFATAVDIDSTFAFAWDNLGICYRQMGRYDDALYAYKKSLRFDPKGHTPLQNIAIVYEYEKDYDKAIESYLNILKIYPEDPEAYYGVGRVYSFYKMDYELALQNMCKAYNIYAKTNSPYRVDAEKNINGLFSKMKEQGKEKRFYEILEENNIKAR